MFWLLIQISRGLSFGYIFTISFSWPFWLAFYCKSIKSVVHSCPWKMFHLSECARTTQKTYMSKFLGDLLDPTVASQPFWSATDRVVKTTSRFRGADLLPQLSHLFSTNFRALQPVLMNAPWTFMMHELSWWISKNANVLRKTKTEATNA